MARFDVAVVGGGPAGLHAAWKAALLYRTVVHFEGRPEQSRIYWVPRIANIPGRYGISGRELLTSGEAVIKQYEEDVERTFVTRHEDVEATSLERLEEPRGFRLRGRTRDGEEIVAEANNVVLATGAADRQPRLADFRRRDIEAILPYANKGLADYCLLCDGHTVEGRRVAVLGCDPGSRTIAKSLKANFGADPVLVPYCNKGEASPGPSDPQAEWSEVEEDLERWGIPILHGRIKDFTGIREGRFGIEFEDGRTEMFDKAWVGMGWYEVRNGLAKQIGAGLDDDGFVRTDRDGQILAGEGDPIAGAYAVGDLRAGAWKQIPVGWGQAEEAVIHAFVATRREEPLEPRHGQKSLGVVGSRETGRRPLA